MDLRQVAVFVWAFSWLGMFLAYGASAAGGHLEPCVPHISGCASISASGRYGAGYFIFKGLMIPAGVFFAVYWMLCERWLQACGDTHSGWRRALLGSRHHRRRVIRALRATFLGHEGDLYRALRRYGTIVFFGFTFVAQLILVYRAQALFGKIPLVRVKVGLCIFMLAEGLALEAFTYFHRERCVAREPHRMARRHGVVLLPVRDLAFVAANGIRRRLPALVGATLAVARIRDMHRRRTERDARRLDPGRDKPVPYGASDRIDGLGPSPCPAPSDRAPCGRVRVAATRSDCLSCPNTRPSTVACRVCRWAGVEVRRGSRRFSGTCSAPSAPGHRRRVRLLGRHRP